MSTQDLPAGKQIQTGGIASLIIRFEQTDCGQLRGYVIDMPVGTPHAFSGLEQLHSLIDRLVRERPLPAP